MRDLVPRVAMVVLSVSFTAWAALTVSILIGRIREDRRERFGAARPGEHATRRLLRRAEPRTHTDWGRWRRIAALNQLLRMRHPMSADLLRAALDDPDPELAGAAIRALGSFEGLWSTKLLVTALRNGRVPRSRIAAQIERHAPAPGPLLAPLLQDPDPAVRFWGATLIGPYSAYGEAELRFLTRDADPNVRAAAVEALSNRSGKAVADAALPLLDDPVWFVRVHAARACGQIMGAEGAEELARLLDDEKWWVRTAAKDALRSIGREVVPALVPVLSSTDEFARNGAAEVLQDVGLVDHLALEEPDSRLLARIYAAGGRGLQEAAESRAARAREDRDVQAA